MFGGFSAIRSLASAGESMTTEPKMTDAESLVSVQSIRTAAYQWYADPDRETFPENIAYFEANWKALPGLRNAVVEQALRDQSAELTRLRKQLQWRPISEAPRDGTWIWAWSAGATRPAQVCWWDGEWKDDEMIDRPNYIAVYDRITHFMPLPPPPGG